MDILGKPIRSWTLDIKNKDTPVVFRHIIENCYVLVLGVSSGSRGRKPQAFWLAFVTCLPAVGRDHLSVDNHETS